MTHFFTGKVEKTHFGPELGVSYFFLLFVRRSPEKAFPSFLFFQHLSKGQKCGAKNPQSRPKPTNPKTFFPSPSPPSPKKKPLLHFCPWPLPLLPSPRRRRKKANSAFLLRNSPISPQKLRFCNLQDRTRGMTMKTFFNVREISSCACGNFFSQPHTHTQRLAGRVGGKKLGCRRERKKRKSRPTL